MHGKLKLAYHSLSVCEQKNIDLQAEIDRLKAENAELKIRFSELLQQDFRGHQLKDCNPLPPRPVFPPTKKVNSWR